MTMGDKDKSGYMSKAELRVCHTTARFVGDDFYDMTMACVIPALPFTIKRQL